MPWSHKKGLISGTPYIRLRWGGGGGIFEVSILYINNLIITVIHVYTRLLPQIWNFRVMKLSHDKVSC